GRVLGHLPRVRLALAVLVRQEHDLGGAVAIDVGDREVDDLEVRELPALARAVDRAHRERAVGGGRRDIGLRIALDVARADGGRRAPSPARRATGTSRTDIVRVGVAPPVIVTDVLPAIDATSPGPSGVTIAATSVAAAPPIENDPPPAP